ncbi:hypothetical protein D3C78_1321350 [compost metagenome]
MIALLTLLQYPGKVTDDGVQKLRAHSVIKPVEVLIAALLSASCSWSVVPCIPSLYCLRLPAQRGAASGSGRNMPT